MIRIATSETSLSAYRLSSPADDVRIHRMTHLEERTMWNLGPPRLRYEDAALDVAIRSDSELSKFKSPSRRSASARSAASPAFRSRNRL